MKKVLAVLLTLTLVLALAVSSSAASLGSKWSEITPVVLDDATNLGTVTVDGSAIVLGVPEGGWHPHAGVKYADPLTVEGLEITFNAKAFTNPSPNGYFAITLSKKAVSKFVDVRKDDCIVAPSSDTARQHGVGTAGNKTISVTFYGDKLEMWITDGSTIKGFDFAKLTTAGTPNSDVTLTFYDTQDGLRIKVNGKDVQYVYEDDETGDDMYADLIIDASEVITNGKAYLSFSAVGYGGSGSPAIAIKKINGTAANSFGGSNGGNNTAPDTADIDVVIIAGAMIVALAAAAFVLKARKA